MTEKDEAGAAAGRFTELPPVGPRSPTSSGEVVSISISRAERTTRRPEFLPPLPLCPAPAAAAVVDDVRLGVVKADMKQGVKRTLSLTVSPCLCVCVWGRGRSWQGAALRAAGAAVVVQLRVSVVYRCVSDWLEGVYACMYARMCAGVSKSVFLYFLESPSAAAFSCASLTGTHWRSPLPGTLSRAARPFPAGAAAAEAGACA